MSAGTWRRRAAALLLAVGAVGVAGAASVTAATQSATPTERIERQLEEAGGLDITEVTPPPNVTATGWLVYDATAGEAVAGLEPGTARPIASLAKLMTALVALDRMQLDEQVTIPARVGDLSGDASRMDARPGEKWPAGDLLRAMLAHSANDAAMALADHVSDGDEDAFVDLMNEQARELGLTSTRFASATGLDPGGTASVSTPIDLVALTTAALEHPEVRDAVAAEQVTVTRPGGGSVELPNRNPLLGAYTGVDGVKTGFTDDAGYMLVVHHEDTRTNGDLLIVTFASTSEQARVADASALLDWARTLRQSVLVVEGGLPLGSIPVQRSDRRVELFACDDLTVTARVGQRLAQEVVVPRSVAAPIAGGDEVGELRVLVGSAADGGDAPLPATVPVCSGDDVPVQGRLDRLRGYAKDWRSAWSLGIDEVGDTWDSATEPDAA